MFHGEPDTGPHQAPWTREHDRHVIDPGTGAGIETRQQPAAEAGAAQRWQARAHIHAGRCGGEHTDVCRHGRRIG